jgi:hypothetical protein
VLKKQCEDSRYTWREVRKSANSCSLCSNLKVEGSRSITEGAEEKMMAYILLRSSEGRSMKGNGFFGALMRPSSSDGYAEGNAEDCGVVDVLSITGIRARKGRAIELRPFVRLVMFFVDILWETEFAWSGVLCL